MHATAPIDASAPAAAPPAAPPPLPPLQHRTPEQLREGLTIEVRGAADDALAAARLIQDAAEYLARQAGTTVGLGRVTLNDRSADRRNALGTATFHGTTGVFNLSTRSTAGLLEGIERLRAEPFAQWSSADQQDFVQATEVVLHEAAHVTLPGYTFADIRSWMRGNRAIEEGSTTLATDVALRGFFELEFGEPIPDEAWAINRSVDAYTRFSERLRRIIDQAAGQDPARSAALMSTIANNTRPTDREQVLAEALASELGGEGVPDQVVTEIAATIPGFVNEQAGSRTRLMELQAWLVDHRAGVASTLEALGERLARADDLDDTTH